MSDDLGTDAGTGAPNEAPVEEVNAAGAPIAKPEKVEAAPEEKPKAPAKPRTDDDDFEELLKKKGGLKYKAGGKEKSVTSAADLRRLLSRVDGTESAASDALKAKQEAAGIKATLANIAKLPPRERLNAMQAAGIDPKLIREAVEESILDEDERSKAQSHLSPREREMQAAIDRLEGESSALKEREAAAQRQQEEAAYVERVTQTGQRLEKTAIGALQKAKIAGEHAPRFLQAIAERLDRNERLGLELDEDELAEVVMKEHESLADQYYGGLEVTALADKLEGMEIPDPDDATKKTTRLKLLMRECAKRIRTKMGGVSSTPTRAALPSASNGKTQTMAELMDAARTFGGGAR